MEIIPNYDRLHLVLSDLLERFERKQFPYDRYRLPQDHENFKFGRNFQIGSKQHASLLFRLCYYMRGRTDSVGAAVKLGELHRRHPRYFDDAKSAKMNPLALQNSMLHIGLTALKDFVPGAWVINSGRMLQRYQGDPRRIFDGVDNFEEACRRVQNDKKGGGFQGFQEKMVSMLLYFFMDEGMIEPFYYPIPVDFHVMRVSVSTGIVEFSENPVGQDVLSQELKANLREMFHKYSESNGIHPNRIAEAVWLLSNLLCKRAPGNRFSEGEYRARSTEIEIHEVDWTKATTRTYARTCGSCPVEPICRYDIGAAPYYVQGQLIPVRFRNKPPQEGLHIV